MKSLVIITEGRTEQKFATEVLSSHLSDKGIHLSHSFNLNGYKTYPKIKKDILNALGRYPNYIITTMFDYYGLSKIKNFAGINFEDLNGKNVAEKINILETSFEQDIDNCKFIPYIQLHEFETFLFVDSNITAVNLSGCKKPDVIEYIEDTKNKVDNNPELINDSIQTAPSKRILKVYPTYDKVSDSLKVCEELGIQKIMNTCPHFKEWIEKIENFGN